MRQYNMNKIIPMPYIDDIYGHAHKISPSYSPPPPVKSVQWDNEQNSHDCTTQFEGTIDRHFYLKTQYLNGNCTSIFMTNDKTVLMDHC